MKIIFKTKLPIIAPYKIEAALNDAVLLRAKTTMEEIVLWPEHIQAKLSNLENIRYLLISVENVKIEYV